MREPENLGDLLLEQNRTKTSVESTNTLVLQHLAETANESVGISRFGDETNTSGFKRAEGDISEEFSKSRRSQIDGCAVVGGGLIAKEVDRLLLEQLISSELECALEEVSSGSWTETSQQSTSTLISDDLSETTDETFVVCDGIELDSCLHAVMANVSN